MEWQDYTVWAIGAAVVFVIVRRLLCSGRRGRGCDACGDVRCPLRKTNDKR